MATESAEPLASLTRMVRKGDKIFIYDDRGNLAVELLFTHDNRNRPAIAVQSRLGGVIRHAERQDRVKSSRACNNNRVK